jgi:hypothetical protein
MLGWTIARFPSNGVIITVGLLEQLAKLTVPRVLASRTGTGASTGQWMSR